MADNSSLEAQISVIGERTEAILRELQAHTATHATIDARLERHESKHTGYDKWLSSMATMLKVVLAIGGTLLLSVIGAGVAKIFEAL